MRSPLTSLRPSQRETRQRLPRFTAWICVLFIAGLGVCTQTGCIGLVSNLMHVTGADLTPAQFEGLEDSRVAVVTLTENSQFSDDISARILGRNITVWLKQEVNDIEVVREDKIANWRDTHGWDDVEFAEIGRGVEADKVLAIEVSNLKLRDGATLYRGRADVQITVIDAKTGKQLFHKELDEFTYPTTAGQSIHESTETRFRKLYLGLLAKRIARNFYRYDSRDDFAIDSIIAR